MTTIIVKNTVKYLKNLAVAKKYTKKYTKKYK